MIGRPRLSELDLWATKERECLDVLTEALRQLSNESRVPDEDEDGINRRLMRMIDGVIARRPDCTLAPPPYEGRSSPAPSDPVRMSREFKRPDFVWLWIDDLAADPRLSRQEFTIECKRLGASPYPRRYVTNGIQRFTNTTHAYGKDMRSGAMVGYLESILIDIALERVNMVATAEGVPLLTLVARRGDDAATLEHGLGRAYPITPFGLTHLWTRLS
jgi:hypothetical protein